jgi:hypothetical protein
MTNISVWLSDVSLRVPGANKLEVEKAIITTIREFCTKSLLWKKKLDAIDIVATVSEYIIAAPVDSAIVDIDRVEVSDLFVNPTSMDLLDRTPEPWRDQQSNQPSEFMVDAEKVLTFREVPIDNLTGGIIVWATLKPTPTAATIPDFIYNDWYEAILNGAVTFLLRIPNKSWSNIDGAEYFNGIYRSLLGDAKAKKVTGKARVSLRVQQSPFSVVG